MSRRLLTALSLTAASFVFSSAPAQPPAASIDKATAPPASADGLVRDQDRLARQYKQFEEALLRMAIRMERSTKPEERAKAEALKKAIDLANKEGIENRFNKLVGVLVNGQTIKVTEMQAAVQQNEELIKVLRDMLDLLLTDNETARLKEEQAKLTAILKRIDELLRQEKIVQAKADSNRVDNKGLNKDQKKVTTGTESVARAMGSPKADDPKGDAKAGDPKGDPKPGDKKGEDKPDTKVAKADPKETKPGDPKKPNDDPKAADGASKPKPGDAKPSDSKGKPSDGSESKPGDPKKGEPKPNENKPNESKPNDPKANKENKPSESKNKGDNKGEAKPSDSKPSDSKPSDSKPSDSKPSDSKPSDSKPSDSKPSDSKPSQSPPGQSKPSEPQDKKPNDQKPPEQPPQEQVPGRKQVQDAIEQQKKAEDNLDKDKRDDASKNIDDAIAKLEEAKRELEKRLKQLREEEMERLLANLQQRCERMLAMQIEVYDGTKRVFGIVEGLPNKQMSRTEEQRSQQLSAREGDIVKEANKGLQLLSEEGSAVAFAAAFESVRDDMVNVEKRLDKYDVGVFTQKMEEDIIAALKEMIEALKKAQQDMKDKKNQPPKPPQQGQPPKQSLLDLLAELKMIKSMQLQVNKRTKDYHVHYPKDEQADESKIQDELKNLAKRQDKIEEITKNIATGKNQ